MQINFRRRLKKDLLLSLLVVTCGTVDASQEYGLFVPGKSTRPVLYFADKVLESGNSQIEYVVVLVHGLNGGTVDCTKSMRSSLGKRYPDTIGRVLFVAPCFLSDTLDSPLCSQYAYWHGSRWSGGDDSPVVSNLSSYDVMDTLLGIFADEAKYPRLKHVFVGGFSAGGQYVIRYVCVGNFHKRDGVQYDFAPGSPSSWLYLDNERIKSNGELSPYVNEYPGYDNWKYGLQNRYRYPEAVAFETIIDNVSSRRVLCFCGTDDDDPAGADLDMTVPAMAQGATRYRRYLNYREYASRHPEWYVNFQFVEVPGVAHSSTGCYADKRILDFAMGRAVGWNCDEDGNHISVRYVDGAVLHEGDGLTEETSIRSLPNAIAQAEDGDRVVLRGGTYPSIDTAGKRIIVEGTKSNGSPIIDGGKTNRCIMGGSGVTWTNSIFRNLTLRNGWSGYGGGARGGIFENCIIENNVATNTGGGAYGCVLVNCTVQSNSSIYAAGVTRSFVYQSRLINNVSTGAGGGAHRSRLLNSVLDGNRASTGGGCYECTNEDCVVRGNYAGSGGGGVYRGVYKRCVFNGNTAGNTGGGAYDSILTDCLVASNSAIYAGGLSRGRVDRTRIVDNISTEAGGGAHRSRIADSLIVGNRAGSSGGGCYECTNVSCTVYSNYAGNKGGGAYGGVYTNCIVWGNASGNGHADFRTSELCGYCLSGTALEGIGNMTGDPKMNAPDKGDFRLRSDSPCLNAGWNGAVVGLTDVLGHSRIQNGIVDIGACEGVAQSTLSTEVEVPYWWLDRYPTLLKTFGGDYELAANAKTGKRSAGEREMYVWEDYVAGTDPTKSNDLFTAYINVSETGAISISYSPVFTDEGSRAMRKYTTMGKKSLLDGGWSEVPAGKEAEYNFFKVKVEMRTP